jgi:hypothetical protein
MLSADSGSLGASYVAAAPYNLNENSYGYGEIQYHHPATWRRQWWRGRRHPAALAERHG